MASRAEDVQVALQRAKKKISNLQQQLSNKETSSESPQETSSAWTPSKELRDSLVDMYRDNPRVNVELRQRLPSPAAQQPSNSTQQPSNSTQQPSNSTQQPSNSTQQSSSPDRPSGGSGEMQVDLSHSRGPSPRAESCVDVPGGGRTSGGPTSVDLRPNLVSTEESSHQAVTFGPITASGRVQMFDRDKNMSFLLNELDSLRETNNKLQDELVQKEKELQRREVEEVLREEQMEARGWEKPAAVLQEVLAAQKDRDQALMSRLLLANEERDEALLRARQLQQASELDNLPPEDTDMDVEVLLRSVCDADSIQEIQQYGSALVQRLRLARGRTSDITAQEMKALMEERDVSVAKCKGLEQELIQEREQQASETTETELLRLQRERGGALELQVLRANQRSQGLLTPLPTSPSDGVSPAGLLMTAHEAPPSRDAPPPHVPPLMVQVQQLSEEKRSMERELQRSQEAEREASERVHRLERLVEVLRKKVGTGSLRAVI